MEMKKNSLRKNPDTGLFSYFTRYRAKYCTWQSISKDKNEYIHL